MIEKNTEIKSNYIPLVSFQNNKEINKYIKKEIEFFFKENKITNYAEEALEIENTISDEDFKYQESNNQKYEDYKFKIDYFYNGILGNLEKDKTGILNYKINYAITFDKKLTPFTNMNTQKKRPYGKIDLGKNPIFYYIYFELQEIINHMKTINFGQ